MDFAALDAVHQSIPTNLDALDSRMVYQSDATQVERSADSKLFVKFYAKSVKDEEESAKQNRAVHKEVVFINIKIPGDKNNDVNRVAFPEDIQRFPIHYERFRKGQEQVIGTPLSAVPFLTDAQVEDYKAIFIRTVEQLAGLPDVQAQQIMGSVAHKQQAQAWLDSFKGAERLRSEFEAKAKADRELIAKMQAQLDELTAAQAAANSSKVNPSPAQVKK